MDRSISESISFDVKLTEKDVINFSMYALRMRKSVLFLCIFYLFVLLLLVTTSILRNGLSGLLDNKLMIFLFLVLFVMFPLTYYFAGKNSFKKNERLQELHHYKVNAQNIYIKGDSFESTFTWDKTAGISENKNSFFIWQQKNTAHIIPKRDLTTSDIDFLKQMASIYKRK